MTIVKATIKQDIKSFIAEINSGDVTQKDHDQVIDDFADKLSDTIVAAIKSATVTVNSGIPVSTTGSAAAQTGVTTAIGTGSLS